MKTITALAAILILGATSLAADAPTKAEIDRTVTAVSAYTFGQPRSPLSDLETLVGATAGNADLRNHFEDQLARSVESARTDEARFFLCRQLATISTDRSVPTLAKLLSDEKTAHPACFALQGNRSLAASQALRDAAASAKGKALLCILSAIADRRDSAAVPLLSKLLTSGDASVVEAASSALGRISGTEAAGILAQARKSAEGDARHVLTNAYLQCAQNLATDGKKDGATAIYRELLSKEEPVLFSRGALVGLIELGGPDVVPLILSKLTGDDRVIQATAIAHIRTVKGANVTQQFAAELPKLPEPLQALLIAALEDRADPAARAAVTDATKSPSDEVRLAAVKALGTLGDASSVPLLVRIVGEGRTDGEKRAALGALRHLQGDGADAAITASMQAAQRAQKVQLIEILTARNAGLAVPALLKEARSDETPVRIAALRSVSQLAAADALPTLLEILASLDSDAGRADAESAIVALARKLPDDATRADAVLNALGSATSINTKSSLIRVLRSIANAKAFAAVQSTMKDADPQIQDTAIRAMADWPDTRATAVVLNICRSTKNETHRIVAMRGVIRLLGLTPSTTQALDAYEELAKLAARPEEKRLVLGGLAQVPHPRALALAQGFLRDPAIAGEAAFAMLSIARTAQGAYRAAVAAAMKELAGVSQGDAVRQQARQIQDNVAKLGDFITAWQVCGPYQREGLNYWSLLGVAFDPEKPDAPPAAWRMLPAATHPQKLTVLDLAGQFGGDHRVAYVRTWIHTDGAREARLELGADDGALVWLNGQHIHTKREPGACVAGSEKINVSLRQGWNVLLVKVVQSTGPWEFCAKLTNRDGSPISGIQVDCARE